MTHEKVLDTNFVFAFMRKFSSKINHTYSRYHPTVGNYLTVLPFKNVMIELLELQLVYTNQTCLRLVYLCRPQSAFLRMLPARQANLSNGFFSHEF